MINLITIGVLFHDVVLFPAMLNFVLNHDFQGRLCLPFQSCLPLQR